MCIACGKKPQAYVGRRFCYDCKPGNGGRPLPCRSCGSVGDYYAKGLCSRCHRSSPNSLDSCRDCFAWPASRTNKWLCEGCLGWRRNHPKVADCLRCSRQIYVDDTAICRLCRRQALLLPPDQRKSESPILWHQLFFAGMLRTGPVKRMARPQRERKESQPRSRRLRYVQLVAFDLPAMNKPPVRTRTCNRCGLRPIKERWATHCYECTTSGPVPPPPCRKCGSTSDYYSGGLCRRCHKCAPQGVESCRDCFAWGATRANGWLCAGCRGWRRNHAVGHCVACQRTLAIGKRGACRLCYLEAVRRRHHLEPWVEVLNASGTHQQLRFANMRIAAGRLRPELMPQPRRTSGIYPVTHRQLVLFEIRPDLVAAKAFGFAEPRDAGLACFLDEQITDHARHHGWGHETTSQTRRGVRILLGVQDTPGASIKATDVLLLPSIHLPSDPVLTVLEATGMLINDRPSSFDRWLEGRLVGLPPMVESELRVSVEVLRNGSSRAPRMRPRQLRVIQATLRNSLPAVRSWIAGGTTTLREVAREDVIAVLPPSGTPRGVMISALRALFRVLKARKLVFINPTVGIPGGPQVQRIPLPADLGTIRHVLADNDPVVSAMGALVAFHAITCKQLSMVLLTDVQDGHLAIGGRHVVLAEPVRRRLGVYLDFRRDRWPQTANPYVFIHFRSAIKIAPVDADWISGRLGGLAQIMREDRIVDELAATGGDLRRVCDLFGLSISGAERYMGAFNHPELEAADHRGIDRPSG
jgi:hypothetical protein